MNSILEDETVRIVYISPSEMHTMFLWILCSGKKSETLMRFCAIFEMGKVDRELSSQSLI